MKIENSSISMASSHQYTSYSHQESMSLLARKSEGMPEAILSLSQKTASRAYVEDMKLYENMKEEEKERKQKENEARNMKSMAEALKKSNQAGGNQFEFSEEYQLKMELMKKLFSLMLSGKRISPEELKDLDLNKLLKRRNSGLSNPNGPCALESGSIMSGASVSMGVSQESGMAVLVSGSGGNPLNVGGNVWQKVTATSGFSTEAESTTFASKGMVQTADGRNIDFQIEVSMSRAFMSEFNMMEVEDVIMKDPLMINLDTNVGTVSDQKFFFDIDSDGSEEEISFAGKGSGFLALDQNGDGKINDGSELFGTGALDGFKDLAKYDEDGNGWIDENDSVFRRLKVWTKDSEGNDHLMDLKKADVGAIYLGNVNTEFTLKNDNNQTNGALRKTGVYLKESTGAVGTLNHVDLAV